MAADCIMKLLELFEVQAAHVQQLVRAVQTNGAALDSSDTGCGKTLCAIEAARALGMRPMVVCPKAVISSWVSTLDRQGVEGDVSNWEKVRTGNTPYLKRAGKVLKWTLPKNTLLIFDECHKAKGRGTLNSKLVQSAKALGIPQLLLSATAAETPAEMRALGYALGLHNMRNFWQWAQAHGCVFDQWNNLKFPKHNRGHLVKLNEDIYPDRGHKMTREELGNHFQKTRVVTEPIDFGSKKKLQKLFKELSDELDKLDDSRAGDGEDPAEITKILRLRQEIEMLKVPIIVEMIKDLRDDGKSVAVFLNFRDSIAAVGDRLGESYGLVQGGQTQTERDEYIDAFQKNRTRVILCNVAAGGVGVSLHDKQGGHPRVALISPTYNAKEFHQTLGRIDRLGGKTESVQRVLVADDSIEIKVVNTMMEKIHNLNLLHKSQPAKPSLHMTTTADEPTIKKIEPDNSDQPAHAEFGPSSLKHVAACPGFISRKGTNEAADRGTRIHEALENDDIDSLASDFEKMIAESCAESRDKICRQHFGDKPIEVHNEIRLDIALLGCSTFGTCDVFVRSGSEDHAVQIDYKTGMGEIDEPQDNYQAKAYVIGAFQKYTDIKKISFYFLIPQRGEVLYHTFHREDIGVLVNEVSGVIMKGTKVRKDFNSTPVEELVPGPKRCEYCHHAMVGDCRALAKLTADVAAKYDEGGEALKVIAGMESMHGSHVDNPEKLAQLYALVPMLEAAASGIKHKMRTVMIEEGREVPGYSIKEMSGKRKINDPLSAYKMIEDQISVEDFLAAVDGIPVGQYEKLVSSLAPRGEKAKRVAQVMGELHTSGAISLGGVRYVIKKDK
jgi:superfamily II DNA or RNA helicase